MDMIPATEAEWSQIVEACFKREAATFDISTASDNLDTRLQKQALQTQLKTRRLPDS